MRAMALLLSTYLKKKKNIAWFFLILLTLILESNWTYILFLQEQTFCIYYILAEYQGNPKNSLFGVTNLTVVFVGFLLLASKVKPDVINDLQYCGDNIATLSDMFVKYGQKI